MSGDPGFWSGRRVLVTGHTGFKGSWLSLWLERLGAEVAGYALEPITDPSLFDLAGVGGGMRSVIGDLADDTRVLEVVEEHRPEVVLHLAAQPIVRDSYQTPAATFRTNVLGTAHVLDAVRAVGSARAVVVVTSDKCYRNRGWPWGYRETDELGGDDPYSASKASAELLTASYRASYFDPADPTTAAVATARAGNVIGGGDWAADRLVADAVRSVTAGTTLAIRNPASVRPWQHVLDCLSGYLLLAQRLAADPALAGAWNFGPDERSVRDVSWIADRLSSLWDGRLAWKPEPDPEAPREATMLRLDSSRARSELAWRPRLGLEDALAWTVQWHRRVDDGEDPRAVSLSQLAAYEERAASQVTP